MQGDPGKLELQSETRSHKQVKTQNKTIELKMNSVQNKKKIKIILYNINIYIIYKV